MNLHSYFTQQGEQRLSDERKFLLYQRICEQRAMPEASFKRAKLLTKKRVYAFLTLVLVFAFFGTFLREMPNIQEYRGFFLQKGNGGLGTVRANHIAEILDFNGEYLIEKEGKTFQNSLIFDGDVIILKANAKIIFNINEHIKAEILGPAKFTISKKADQGYRLYLMEGDFLKLEGKDQTDALEVETEEMSFETQKNDAIALELTKTEKQTQLKNTGAPLLVTSKKSKTAQAPTKLETAKLLTMQENDITQIADVEGFEKALSTNKNLTHTTSLAQTTSGTQLSKEEIIDEGLALLSGADTSFLASTLDLDSENQAEISSGLDYQKDEKKVPTEKQLSQITAALNGSFLLADMQLLYQAKQGENPQALEAAYRNIAWRLKSIGDTYKLQIELAQNEAGLLKELAALQKGLNAYHLPPQKMEQLKVLENWIKVFQAGIGDEDWNSYRTALPQNLQFK